MSETKIVRLTSPKWDTQKPIYDAARQADVATWTGVATVDKYEGEVTAEQIASGAVSPYERVIGTPNLLMYGGASVLWHRVIGGTTVGAFDNSNAYIGVGDSTTAAAASQQDLSASTNKLRKAMDSTYPVHTDSATLVGGASIVFKSTFGTSDANWVWNEWAIFNASASGRMLNRKVENLGTKSSGTWVLQLTLSLA